MKGSLISVMNVEQIVLKFLNGSVVGFAVILEMVFLIDRGSLVELKGLEII
jgi:hypothetical protein